MHLLVLEPFGNKFRDPVGFHYGHSSEILLGGQNEIVQVS